MTEGRVLQFPAPLRLPAAIHGKYSKAGRAMDRLAFRYVKKLLAGEQIEDPELVVVPPRTVLITGNVGEPVDVWHLALISGLIGMARSDAYTLSSEAGKSSEESTAASEEVGARMRRFLLERPWGVLGGVIAGFVVDDAEELARHADLALEQIDRFAGYRFKAHVDGFGFEFPEYDHIGLLEQHLLGPALGWDESVGDADVKTRLRRAVDRMRAADFGEVRDVLADCILRVQREDPFALQGRMPDAVPPDELRARLADLPDALIDTNRVGAIPNCINLACAMWPELQE